MRRHESIGYGSFNTFRSGDENSRQYDYGNPEGHSRGGRSVYGQMSRDNEASNRPYSTTSGYGSSYNENDYGNSNNYSGNSQYGSQNRNQNQGWSNQNQQQNYGSGNYGNSSGYGNRQNDRDNSWMDRTGNRMENWADRAGNQMDRWGNRISSAWDRMTDQDDSGHNYRNSNRNHWTDMERSMGGQHNYSHGNANQNRYSDNYDGDSSSSYGNRYEPRYGTHNDRYENIRRSHQDDGGFFDHLGNRISNAWDRWIGNDEDEQRQYENRSRYGSSGHRSDRDHNW